MDTMRLIDLLEKQIDSLKCAKDVAYRERNKLVVALTKFFPSYLMRHPQDPDWEQDWMWIVCIEGPTGQMTWHIHDSEIELFDHLPRSDVNTFDGHTTDEKYERLAAIPRVW